MIQPIDLIMHGCNNSSAVMDYCNLFACKLFRRFISGTFGIVSLADHMDDFLCLGPRILMTHIFREDYL